MDEIDAVVVKMRNEGSSINEIARAVGRAYTPVRRRIKLAEEAGLILPEAKLLYAKHKRSNEELRAAITGASNFKEALAALGLTNQSSGNRTMLKKHAVRLGLDISTWSSTVDYSGRRQKIPLEEILIENSTYSTSLLRKRLVAEGVLKGECAICAIDSWLGQALSLELDHINGVNTDHRIENLRILCPNCHSQTPTWRGRNIKKK